MTRKRENLLLAALAAIQFIHIVDFMIMMPLGDRLTEIFQIEPSAFALLVASYTLTSGVVSFITAFFIDRLDRKAALVPAFAGLLIGTFATGFAPSYELLLAARITTGAFGGILSGLVLAIIGDVIPNERRGSAMGIIMAAFSAAATVGVPLGLYLANTWNWHTPFTSLGAFGVLLLLYAIWAVPSLRGHMAGGSSRPSPLRSIQHAFTRKNQLKALALMTFLVLGQFTVIPFIAPYLEANVQLSPNEVALVYFFGGLATVFSAPLLGRFADRFGRARVFTVALLLSLIPLYLVTNLEPTSLVAIYSISVLFFVFISGRMIPATTMVTSSVPANERGSFMSINTSFRELAGAAGTLIAGSIVVNTGTAENAFYEQYEIVGYIAIAASLVALVIGQTIKVVDEPTMASPPTATANNGKDNSNPLKTDRATY